MKFAIPLADGRLTAHFGHCREFAFIETSDNRIISRQVQTPPPHEPGVLPQWLAEHQVDIVLAGGMGHRAIDLLGTAGIKVITGVTAAEPETLVTQYLQNTLQTGDNACAGGGGHGHECASHPHAG